MAKCCPSACGRLATAAIFISVGIVQVIISIILLKSKYASILFFPNISTALSNIVVGILLGVASTVWRTINKNSSKHANRRNALASLVGSIFILNSTTAAMLIVGEGNNHLAFDLENGEKEILAYAYSASVCSPIVCVVVSIAFLTEICFRRKPKTIKTLDIKNILNGDDTQLYDWVYTSNLPKPDPEILRTALSSESESTESESDSSSDLPVPLHLRSRSSLSDIKSSMHDSLNSSSFQFSPNRSLEDSVSPSFLKTRYIPRLKHSSIIKTPVLSYDEPFNSSRNVGLNERSTPTMVAYRSDCKPGTPVRIKSSNILEKSTYSPNFQFNTSALSPCPKAKLSFSPINQGTSSRLQMIKKAKYVNRDEPSTSRQYSMEDSIEYEDSVSGVRNLPSRKKIYSPNPHSNIYRTSTTDQTKAHSELENLDNSAIHFDADRVSVFKEIYLDESLPEIGDKERLSSSSRLTESAVEEKNDSFRSRGDLSLIVRNSNFRKKLSSKLVPAAGPVISDGHNFYKTSSRKSVRNGRMKPYSKSKNSYDKYLQTGFSSFKSRRQIDKVDSVANPTEQGFSMNRSPMTSISEKPADKELDSFLPNSSTQTSGYMSASYEESEDEADLKPNSSSVSSRQQPSPAPKLIADEIRERYRKRTERVSFELDNR